MLRAAVPNNDSEHSFYNISILRFSFFILLRMQYIPILIPNFWLTADGFSKLQEKVADKASVANK